MIPRRFLTCRFRLAGLEEVADLAAILNGVVSKIQQVFSPLALALTQIYTNHMIIKPSNLNLQLDSQTSSPLLVQ